MSENIAARHAPKLTPERIQWLNCLAPGDIVLSVSVSAKAKNPRLKRYEAIVISTTEIKITINHTNKPKNPTTKLFPKDTGVQAPTSDPFSAWYIAPIETMQSSSLDETVNELVNYILNYESDTLSARANVITRPQAETIASKLIANLTDDIDGATLNNLLDSLKD